MNGSIPETFAIDTRGTSTQIAYVLSVAIAAILASVLIASMSGIIADEQSSAAEYEMDSAGERLASQIQDVDRVADGNPNDIELDAEPPRSVSNKQYDITLEEEQLRLETSDEEQSTIALRIQNAEIDETTVDGGPVKIVYDTENNEITLEER